MNVKNALSLLLVPVVLTRQLYKKTRLSLDVRAFKHQIATGSITPGKAAGILSARYRSSISYVEAVKRLKEK